MTTPEEKRQADGWRAVERIVLGIEHLDTIIDNLMAHGSETLIFDLPERFQAAAAYVELAAATLIGDIQ